MRFILALVTALSIPSVAHAQFRFNVKFDLTDKSVYNYNYHIRGIEFELEKEYKKNRIGLSGFAVGIRREPYTNLNGFGTRNNVTIWDEGDYLYARVYRKFNLKVVELNPGVSFVFGVPGSTLDASSENTHVYPIRNFNVPKYSIRDAGLFYPELSVTVRKKLVKNIFSLEMPLSLRVVKFGRTISPNLSEKSTFLMPSIGLRAGVRLF